jgi:aspartate kinase
MDMLLTTGERVSAALLTMALAAQGVDALSFTGSQVGSSRQRAPQGEDRRGQGRPRARRARTGQGRGGRRVPGCQHRPRDHHHGPGASDLTASALAKALDADACEIYTDVTGVFTADPRIVPQARKLARVNFDEMLEMAGAGSKVLALRSVEFARNHNVPLHVRSSFTWEQGTWITPEEPSMEDPIISGVVTDTSESKVTIQSVPTGRASRPRCSSRSPTRT